MDFWINFFGTRAVCSCDLLWVLHKSSNEYELYSYPDCTRDSAKVYKRSNEDHRQCSQINFLISILITIF